MVYFNSIVMLSIAITLYIYLASTGVVLYANIAHLVLGLSLAFEQSSYALWAFWQYLIDHSFCPWLMVFRRRKTDVILEQASDYANAAGNSDTLSGFFTNSIECIVSVCELFVGPLIAAALAILQIYWTFKSTALCFSKAFNLFR